ncbi:MAG: 1-acyl-sn-glycerol-3-phosphate acyltransferase [Pelagibacterales bacterium MED-G40]|nr:MAG: 1-acyl-sn-glycerol-3-phosphate acyltransferase [Pelagibacterales bacterium MED-G40]|tara:strand:+ start:249 stop:956 length:708 start_codon:yes stop_codon:yes gene_type:complete
MHFIRSFLFTILFYVTLILVFILAIPALILPSKATLICGKILAHIIIFLLRFILGVKVSFSGIENLKKNERFFVASAHQSLLETFILQAPLQYPIFILKKELLKIPLFGWYLKKIGSIDIVRDTTTKDNLNFFDKIKNIIEISKRPLLIFPQGTRVKFGDRLPFKKGAGRIYEALNLPCVPVALNTGKVWPKNSFLKYNYDIKISFLEPIEPGKDKNDFIKKLENNIYSEIDRLN